MAMVDYGALLKINGRIANRDTFFMDMQNAVGWVDYPRIRYDDCDHLDDEFCSDCGECPRAQTRHMSDPEFGEWDVVAGDCRGNKICIDNKIDGNCFAYAGDEEFTVAVYKTGAILTNKSDSLYMYIWDLTLGDKEKYWEPRISRMARDITIQVGEMPVHIRIKRLGESNVFYMRFWYKTSLYELVYGYGIDPDREVWNELKTRYANKKVIRFVDDFWKEGKI